MFDAAVYYRGMDSFLPNRHCKDSSSYVDVGQWIIILQGTNWSGRQSF